MLRCVKGKWIHPNRLVLDDNKVLYVIPYGIISDNYRAMLPLDVFMLIDERNVIKDIVENSMLEV